MPAGIAACSLLRCLFSRPIIDSSPPKNHAGAREMTFFASHDVWISGGVFKYPLEGHTGRQWPRLAVWDLNLPIDGPVLVYISCGALEMDKAQRVDGVLRRIRLFCPTPWPWGLFSDFGV